MHIRLKQRTLRRSTILPSRCTPDLIIVAHEEHRSAEQIEEALACDRFQEQEVSHYKVELAE